MVKIGRARAKRPTATDSPSVAPGTKKWELVQAEPASRVLRIERSDRREDVLERLLPGLAEPLSDPPMTAWLLCAALRRVLCLLGIDSAGFRATGVCQGFV
jgi:hypothetical protein